MMYFKQTLLLLTSLFIIALLVASTSVSAQVDISSEVCSGELGTGEVPAVCEDIEATGNENTLFGPNGVLTLVVNVLSIITAIIAIIVMIISGIMLLLSRGDSQKVSKARNQIIYAIIGLVVVILSQSLVRLVINRVIS